ncbi:hypothetical protein DBV05_g878 [Lasiodiplodia theobromae]|uniref:Uncharacterized protein n=1 Tax=Lasiodiplodia theobromae TaxID=45133 RepID=A0A5N5DWQ6_9PEZI|nr:hypothetical protein DBV05_g878 [Lasiodiplodia theobromae]
MASPSERGTFPVDSPSSRRFNPTTAAPAGDSGSSSSTVSTLERSFGGLDINPSPPPPPPLPESLLPVPVPVPLPPLSPRPTYGIVSRTFMERRWQRWKYEREREMERQMGRHTTSLAAATATAIRGEHWQRRSLAAESRVRTAGIARRRQTPRREPAAAAAAARGTRVWWKDDGVMAEQARPFLMPLVPGDGRGRNVLFKDHFQRYPEVEWFREQGVGVMEEENDDGDDGDDDMDEDEDEEENVGGDQRTREDSVMGDD